MGGRIRRACEETRAEQKQDPESGQKLVRGVRAGRGSLGQPAPREWGGLGVGGDQSALGSFAAASALSEGVGGGVL